MVVVLKPNTPVEKRNTLIAELESMGVKVQVSEGTETTVLGLIGDTSHINQDRILSNEIVANVLRVQEPFKKANRMFKPESTVVEVNGRKIGEGYFCVITGPCSVESEEQILTIAEEVKKTEQHFSAEGHINPEHRLIPSRGLGWKVLNT